MEECKCCGHKKDNHEYAEFHGIEDYGQCSKCNCLLFLA